MITDRFYLEPKSGIVPEFSGLYRFLSNFYVEPDGTHVEGEYQTAKCPERALQFRGLTPGKTKRLGSRVPLRPDWDKVKIGVMAGLVAKKFEDHPQLREMLVATGAAQLEEGNYWGDSFWGVYQGVGHNWLGRTLMGVRLYYRR